MKIMCLKTQKTRVHREKAPFTSHNIEKYYAFL